MKRNLPGLRTLYVVMLVLLMAAVAEAAVFVNVTTDHADAIYHVGETATFSIKVLDTSQAVGDRVISWTITKDGGALLKSGSVKLQDGSAQVSGSMSEPGFMHLNITYTSGGTTTTHKAGVAYDPTEIKPAMPTPDDFDAFWDEKKALLAQVPVNSTMKPVASSNSSIAIFDVTVDALGAPVSGYLVRPANAKPKSLPVIITLQGAGVSSASTSDTWAKEGLITFSVNAHGLPNGQPATYYSNLYASGGALNGYYAFGKESRDEFYFLGMFLRVVRAIDFVTTLPEWDGKTIILYGTSQGGGQAYAGAGLDPRVTFFVAGVSAMADIAGGSLIPNRPGGWPWRYLSDNITSLEQRQRIIETSRYFDATNFATRVKADGFFTVGFIDTTCAPTAVYAAYNAVPTKKAIYNDIPTGHANSSKATQLMKEAVLNHVAEMKQKGN
jgi:cephalosporin-C deacetylase